MEKISIEVFGLQTLDAFERDLFFDFFDLTLTCSSYEFVRDNVTYVSVFGLSLEGTRSVVL